jgi:protein-S-isoprenylcysteine O-methyltransferase Ste14
MDGKNQNIKNDPEIRKNIIRRIVQIIITFSLFFTALFLSAGTLAWKWGLIYLALNVLMLIVNALLLPREVIAERGAKKENVKKWDKILSLIGMIPYFGMFIVPGLDYRFGWSGEPGMSVRVIGLTLLLLSNALLIWAMVSNKFFSTQVRLQFDRGHKVETGGPYRFVRHPGYVGFITSSFSAPLILGSLWGLIPSALFIPFFAVRTALEDATLQRELDGYKDYAKKVRYRLIPGIW